MAINSDTSSPTESSSTSAASSLDAFHPLYLHPSDTPGTMLVSIPFGGTSFGDWKKGMLILLSAKNKVQLIDGTLIEPIPNSQLYPHWQYCNNMVKAWIMNSLSKDIAKIILYYNTTIEA
ncbi:uncharacterized protein [Nicotiana tomentosiformis]|uniref:uncharacterized protein n=1 Tax=Nicotiana tomentosiformis TaxID=4098 RepID=UPI00051C2B5F|nr:uncharacterized protein LOC117279500 [Nicotiana tomentosiformis]